jgi:hypothetical protein
MSQLISEYYECNISRIIMFSKTMLASEDMFIRLYKDLVVLIDGKTNFYAFTLCKLLFYKDTPMTHMS